MDLQSITTSAEPCFVMRDGSNIILSPQTYEDWKALGFSEKLHLNRNRTGGTSYLRLHACRPDGARTKHTAAHLVMALMMVRLERAGGPTAAPKGWIVKSLNGNPLDLRDENLVAVPASGARNTFNAVWSVRDRFKRIDAGKPVQDRSKGRKGKC